MSEIRFQAMHSRIQSARIDYAVPSPHRIVERPKENKMIDGNPDGDLWPLASKGFLKTLNLRFDGTHFLSGNTPLTVALEIDKEVIYHATVLCHHAGPFFDKVW